MKAPFSISNVAKIHVYKEPVRMSNSFDGLATFIEKSNLDPLSGDLFLFVNKAKTYIKVYYHHKGGGNIFAKRIPRGIFDMTDKTKLTFAELQNLIDRVIVHGAKKLPHLKTATA